MTKFKKFTIIGAMLLMVGATSITAFAATDFNSAEARAERLETKKEILAERVEAGQITQERANEIISAIEKNQLNCDGTGICGNGQRSCGEFGGMLGNGNGNGFRGGQGNGGGNCGNCLLDE